MGAQLGVPYGHMGCRQFGVQFGYLDVYDLPFCVPYDVVLLLDVPVVLFCVPYDVVLLLDVPMDLCTQLYSPVQCTMSMIKLDYAPLITFSHQTVVRPRSDLSCQCNA